MSDAVTDRQIPAVVREILAKRGVAEGDFEHFLYPDYARDLHDPFLLSDMKPAVKRILEAAQKHEKVIVYGDYDIDGITASAVLIEGLAAQGIDATSYIPDRFEEGYGINKEALEQLQKDGAQLVISVDCGITSVVEADWAREHHLDLIITDHHTPAETTPAAIAVINPKRANDKYPFKDLAGVGVAFKLVQALQARTGQPADGQEKWLLDLVALGTVCDVVELVGENRVLVSFGLKVLRQTKRPGLVALAAVAGVELDKLQASHLGFAFGPRMNAAGRLEHAGQSLELVTTTDTAWAAQIAAELDDLNRRRRAEQATIVAEAEQQAADHTDDPVLVLAKEDWNHGIVGIVAARIAEKHHKPTLILQIMGDTAKGSARSAGDFNLVDGLRSVSHHLEKFGGHAYAAGATLPTANIEAVRQGLNDYFRDGAFVADQTTARPTDLQVATVDTELFDSLKLLEPYGAGNQQPVLELPDLTITELRPVGADGKHLKLGFQSGSVNLPGIGFGLAERYSDLKVGDEVTAQFRLEENHFQGNTTLQLQILSLTPPS